MVPNPVVNRRKAIDYVDISYFHTYICTLHDVSCEGLRMSTLLRGTDNHKHCGLHDTTKELNQP